MSWKKKDKNDVMIFESLKDHLGNEILSNSGENIELYTIWGKITPSFITKKTKSNYLKLET